MNDLKKKWLETVERKNSLLCVGLDPVEPSQRQADINLTDGDRLQWCLDFVSTISPYASAVKVNRNYIKDFSRAQTKELVATIHSHDLLAIDDSKISDIGETNDAALYHAKQEGFDAVTFSPFPGNAEQTAEMAKERKIGLFALVLMSNPEYRVSKNATIQGMKGYEFFAKQVHDFQIEGMVIGAPSKQNHLEEVEIRMARQLAGNKLVLMPGVGVQGGETEFMLKLFGKNLMVCVTRAILYAEDPAKAAREFQEGLKV